MRGGKGKATPSQEAKLQKASSEKGLASILNDQHFAPPLTKPANYTGGSSSRSPKSTANPQTNNGSEYVLVDAGDAVETAAEIGDAMKVKLMEKEAELQKVKDECRREAVKLHRRNAEMEHEISDLKMQLNRVQAKPTVSSPPDQHAKILDDLLEKIETMTARSHTALEQANSEALLREKEALQFRILELESTILGLELRAQHAAAAVLESERRAASLVETDSAAASPSTPSSSIAIAPLPAKSREDNTAAVLKMAEGRYALHMKLMAAEERGRLLAAARKSDPVPACGSPLVAESVQEVETESKPAPPPSPPVFSTKIVPRAVKMREDAAVAVLKMAEGRYAAHKKLMAAEERGRLLEAARAKVDPPCDSRLVAESVREVERLVAEVERLVKGRAADAAVFAVRLAAAEEKAVAAAKEAESLRGERREESERARVQREEDAAARQKLARLKDVQSEKLAVLAMKKKGADERARLSEATHAADQAAFERRMEETETTVKEFARRVEELKAEGEIVRVRAERLEVAAATAGARESSALVKAALAESAMAAAMAACRAKDADAKMMRDCHMAETEGLVKQLEETKQLQKQKTSEVQPLQKHKKTKESQLEKKFHMAEQANDLLFKSALEAKWRARDLEVQLARSQQELSRKKDSAEVFQQRATAAERALRDARTAGQSVAKAAAQSAPSPVTSVPAPTPVSSAARSVAALTPASKPPLAPIPPMASTFAGQYSPEQNLLSKMKAKGAKERALIEAAQVKGAKERAFIEAAEAKGDKERALIEAAQAKASGGAELAKLEKMWTAEKERAAGAANMLAVEREEKRRLECDVDSFRQSLTEHASRLEEREGALEEAGRALRRMEHELHSVREELLREQAGTQVLSARVKLTTVLENTIKKKDEDLRNMEGILLKRVEELQKIESVLRVKNVEMQRIQAIAAAASANEKGLTAQLMRAQSGVKVMTDSHMAEKQGLAKQLDETRQLQTTLSCLLESKTQEVQQLKKELEDVKKLQAFAGPSTPKAGPSTLKAASTPKSEARRRMRKQEQAQPTSPLPPILPTPAVSAVASLAPGPAPVRTRLEPSTTTPAPPPAKLEDTSTPRSSSAPTPTPGRKTRGKKAKKSRGKMQASTSDALAEKDAAGGGGGVAIDSLSSPPAIIVALLLALIAALCTYLT